MYKPVAGLRWMQRMTPFFIYDGTTWLETRRSDNAAAGPTSLFSDEFESGGFSSGGWSTQNGNASVTGAAAFTGSFGAKLKKTTWIEKALSTSGFATIHVKYARKTSNKLDSGEFLYAEWHDGTSWTELESTQETSWASKDWTLGSGADNNASFKVRFRLNASANNETAFVDDVEILGTAQ